MHQRKQKATKEIGKPLKKIFLNFLEIGKPLKKIEFWSRKIGFWARKISIFPKTFSSFWQFGGLVLTPNLLSCAHMDLLDWFFRIQLLITSAFETITSNNFIRYTPSLELPTPHSTGYEPKASDARHFDTRFVLPSSKLSATTTRYFVHIFNQRFKRWWSWTRTQTSFLVGYSHSKAICYCYFHRELFLVSQCILLSSPFKF